MISDSFFYADFWYRTEFEAPAAAPGRHVFLNFDGVNWKAEVFLNGEKLGRVEGGFTRGRFDVTRHLRPGRNALAVRVEKNAHARQHRSRRRSRRAGLNGGALGADNPTYHASIGWDWIPTVRGRNTGLWNDVYLTTSGPVTIEDPFVRTTLPLPDTSRADVRVEVALAQPRCGAGQRHSCAAASATCAFEQTGDARRGRDEDRRASTRQTHPALRLTNPRLWWPNGYGEPHLYDVDAGVRGGAGAVSDAQGASRPACASSPTARRAAPCGSGSTAGASSPRGGNWGFPETNLRYRGREYDAAVRYHRDMNFTMIRNWVGQTGDDEFYEACDRHGIVVWQDFWLANPWDGPDPDDDALFMANARDIVRRIRNHPSVGLYCGRNEGYPPPGARRRASARRSRSCTPTCRYIPHSAEGAVSGGGPYSRAAAQASTSRSARRRSSTASWACRTSSATTACAQMMPEAALWPQGARLGAPRLQPRAAPRRLAGFRRADRRELRRRRQRGRVGAPRAVRQLRRLPRDVRGPEQEPHGPAALDEPPGVAVVRVADLRLLLRPDGRLLRQPQGLGAAARPVEPGHRRGRGRELQRRRAARASPCTPRS